MSDAAAPQALSDVERVKLSAIDRAVAIGGAGVPTLTAMLTEPSWVVRRAVVRGLAAVGAPAVPALLDILRRRRDDEGRIAAAVEALASSTSDVDDAVAELARDALAPVVCDALQILGRRRAKRATPLLRELMAGPDENIAVAAIEALGRIGDTAAVDSLVEAVRSKSFFRVFPAIDVLGRAGDPRAVAPLAELLDDPLYAFEVARALGRTGESAAVAPLCRLLAQKGDMATRTAAVALADLHEWAEHRHGTPSSVVRALRSLPNRTALARRLSHFIREATPPEKAAIACVLGSLGSEESLAVLSELVEAPPPVGPAAERALARLSAEAQAELVRVLEQGASAQRLAVLPLLTRPVDESVIARCLEDPDAAVRAETCSALARFADPSRVAPLFERLGDSDTRVVQAAVAAIQSLGGAETEAKALELSRSRDDSLRRSALRILAYFGYPAAFDTMVEALDATDPRVRDAGIHGLSFIEDPRATRVLLRAAGAASQRTRASVMKALGQRPAEADTVAAVVRGLVDEDPWVRYYACQSIGKLGLVDVASEVERLLADPAGHVRIAAIEALSLIGGQAARRALRAAAASGDEDIRRAALVGLGLTGDTEALAVLVSAAVADDAMTRLIAISSLAEFDTMEVLPVLEKAGRDPEDTVRTAALACIGARSGPEATATLIRMLDVADDPEPIIVTLSSPVKGRVAGIAAALFTAEDRLARHLVAVLGRMDNAEAIGALVEAMSTHPVVVRKAVAATLGALETSAGMEALRIAAKTDQEPDVRRIAELLVSGRP
jgi:HEAT repeat protein